MGVVHACFSTSHIRHCQKITNIFMLSQKQNRFGGKNLNAKKIVKIAKVFDKEATG